MDGGWRSAAKIRLFHEHGYLAVPKVFSIRPCLLLVCVYFSWFAQRGITRIWRIIDHLLPARHVPGEIFRKGRVLTWLQKKFEFFILLLPYECPDECHFPYTIIYGQVHSQDISAMLCLTPPVETPSVKKVWNEISIGSINTRYMYLHQSLFLLNTCMLDRFAQCKPVNCYHSSSSRRSSTCKEISQQQGLGYAQ